MNNKYLPLIHNSLRNFRTGHLVTYKAQGNGQKGGMIWVEEETVTWNHNKKEEEDKKGNNEEEEEGGEEEEEELSCELNKESFSQNWNFNFKFNVCQFVRHSHNVAQAIQYFVSLRMRAKKC
jgi:hypothetical protein